jgi:hypothetical protein
VVAATLTPETYRGPFAVSPDIAETRAAVAERNVILGPNDIDFGENVGKPGKIEACIRLLAMG